MNHDANLNAVIFSLWGESLSRIDAVLLEIRHVQLNIIRELREEPLYDILKYEESYLWGQYKSNAAGHTANWFEFLDKHGVGTAKQLTNCWVIRLNPRTVLADQRKWESQKKNFNGYFDSDAFKAAAEKADNLYNNRDVGRGYGPSHTQIFQNFAALQVLKQNVLRDKIILSFWADKAASIKLSTTDVELMPPQDINAVGRFLTARSGAIFRLTGYIQRLEDLRVPHERSSDLSLADSTRPISMRRREQGSYNEYLTHRAVRYNRVLYGLLKESGDLVKEARPYVHHRWLHSAQSSSTLFDDESLPAESEIGMATSRPEFRQQYLNTSFWMVDRPDLQPIIAHEAAHFFMRIAFDDIGEAKLKRNRGEIGQLLVRLSKIMYFYDNPSYFEDDFPILKLDILREIGADFIGSSRNSIAYLWALFLENIGLDLYESLETDRTSCDLSKIEEAEAAGFALRFGKASKFGSQLWAFRLFCAIEWIEGIDDQNHENPLAKTLISTIKAITQILLRYVELHGGRTYVSGQGRKFLLKMSEAACREIKNSGAVEKFKKYQKKLSDESKAAGYCSSNKEFDPELYLPDDIRKSIVVWMKTLKRNRHEKGILRRAQGGDFELTHWPAYFGALQSNNATEDAIKGEGHLFKTVQDVPWAAFLMRGIDFTFLNYADACDRRWAIDEVFRDFDPGSDLYLIVHEMQTWLRSSPRRRLARAVRVVGDLLKSVGDSLHTFAQGAVNEDAFLTHFEEYWLSYYNIDRSGRSPDPHPKVKVIWKTILPDLYKWLTGNDILDATIPEKLNRYRSVYPNASSGHGNPAHAAGGAPSGSNKLVAIDLVLKKHLSPGDEILGRQTTPRDSLAKLREDIRKHLGEDEQPSCLRSFSELYSYLEVCTSAFGEKECGDKLKKLASDLSSRLEKTATCNSTFPSSLIKIKMGAPREPQAHENFLCGKVAWEENGGPSHCGAQRAQQLTSVLGRHDILAFGQSSSQLTFAIPDIAPSRNKESMAPFSFRWERTLPLFFEKDKSPPIINAENFMALITVTLTGRDSRLDFFLAISKAVNRCSKKAAAPRNSLECAASRFDPETDVLMLAEGSADIAIIVQHRNCGRQDLSSRLNDVLAIQTSLREYFLVENLETILSPKALEVVQSQANKTDPSNSRYSLLLQMRLKSDRNLSPTLALVEKSLKSVPLPSGVSWTRTPGRLDYELYLTGDQTRDALTTACNNMRRSADGTYAGNPLNWLLYLAGLLPSQTPPGDLRHFRYDFLVDEFISTLGTSVELDPCD